jgi:hypothetical protein
VRPTFHSLVAFDSPLQGARPSKRKTGDGNPLKNEHRRKKAKVKSTLPPGAQVIELENFPTPYAATTTPDAPSASIPPPHASSTSTTVSQTATILSSESRNSHFPSAPDLSVSTSTPEQTGTCDAAHGPSQGMLTEL